MNPPSGPIYTTVAKFEQLADRWPDEAWSVVIEFEEGSADAQRRMVVEMHMLVEAAPEELLVPGSRFQLFEGAQCVACGIVISDDAFGCSV
ncbi:MAG: hypothetical protein H6729_11235 [Deltaproteobacteria bacterium]|nr:hypothetical protein [Deltaproteobacteria bacterium]